MSARATGPETLGSLSDEPEITTRTASRPRRSPASRRCRSLSAGCARDKIAIVCAIVVLFFLLVAVFADLIANLFGVSLETVTACEVLDVLAEPGSATRRRARRYHGFDPEHPFGIAPRTGDGQPGPLDLRLPHLADDRRRGDARSPSVDRHRPRPGRRASPAASSTRSCPSSPTCSSRSRSCWPR